MTGHCARYTIAYGVIKNVKTVEHPKLIESRELTSEDGTRYHLRGMAWQAELHTDNGEVVRVYRQPWSDDTLRDGLCWYPITADGWSHDVFGR